MTKHLLAIALLTAAAIPAHAQLAQLTVKTGVENWKWVEFTESGDEYLNEKGTVGPTVSLGLTIKERNRWVHELDLTSSVGEITYNGAYIGGPKLTSHTKYNTLRLGYAANIPSIWEGTYWNVSVAYEKRDRSIWNPAAATYQQEDYQNTFLGAGLKWLPPEHFGYFGGFGVIASLANRMDPHATRLGFDSNPTLKPKASLGYYMELGYQWNKNWAIQMRHELTRFGISQKERVVQNGDAYLIWQPRADLNRTSVNLSYRF